MVFPVCRIRQVHDIVFYDVAVFIPDDQSGIVVICPPSAVPFRVLYLVRTGISKKLFLCLSIGGSSAVRPERDLPCRQQVRKRILTGFSIVHPLGSSVLIRYLCRCFCDISVIGRIRHLQILADFFHHAPEGRVLRPFTIKPLILILFFIPGKIIILIKKTQ